MARAIRLALGIVLSGAVSSGVNAAQEVSADAFVGIWTGPTLHGLAGTGWGGQDCVIDWEFRADHILVVDHMYSYGYSWATGSWDVLWDPETGHDMLYVLLMQMNGSNPGFGPEVAQFAFAAKLGPDGQMDMVMTYSATDGKDGDAATTPFATRLCDRRPGPPPPDR